MSILLVTLEEVKPNLYLTTDDTERDADILLKIQIASAIVMKHMKLATYPDDWYDDDSPSLLIVPDDVRGAAILVTTELFENRESSTVQVLSDTVKMLLEPYKARTIA